MRRRFSLPSLTSVNGGGHFIHAKNMNSDNRSRMLVSRTAFAICGVTLLEGSRLALGINERDGPVENVFGSQ